MHSIPLLSMSAPRRPVYIKHTATSFTLPLIPLTISTPLLTPVRPIRVGTCRGSYQIHVRLRAIDIWCRMQRFPGWEKSFLRYALCPAGGCRLQRKFAVSCVLCEGTGWTWRCTATECCSRRWCWRSRTPTSASRGAARRPAALRRHWPRQPGQVIRGPRVKGHASWQDDYDDGFKSGNSLMFVLIKKKELCVLLSMECSGIKMDIFF